MRRHPIPVRVMLIGLGESSGMSPDAQCDGYEEKAVVRVKDAEWTFRS